MPMRDIILIHNWWAGDPSAREIVSAYTTRVQSDGGVVEAEDCLISRVENLKRKGIWDKASAVWLPHGYKEGKLYAAKGGASADLTHVRAGTRYRKGPTYVEDLPYNLLKYSEDFTNGYWFKTEVAITGNVITVPGGGITGAKVVPSATLGQHRFYTTASLNGKRFTVRAKAGEYSYMSLGFGGGLAASGIIFNLADGTISGSTGGYDATIELISDGWYDCTVEYIGGSGFVTALQHFIIVRNADVASNYSGDTTSGIYVARAYASLYTRDYFKTTDRFNVPALDYTNDTCPAWSLEKASTNLFTRSELFEDTTWTTNAERVTVSSNATVAPDGLTTADLLSETVSLGVHVVQQTISKAASSIQYAFSAFVKGGLGRDWITLQCNNGSNLAGGYFNISTGVIGSTFVGGSGFTANELSIKDYGNGWYRCVLVCTSNTATLMANRIGIATGDGNNSYMGSTSNGVYVWGAQLEQSSYATSYIPTTTATVSRIADSVDALYPSGTNLLLQSQTFDNATWMKGDSSVVANVITAPDGTLTADKLNASTTNQFHGIYHNPGLQFIAGVTYTISVYAKAGEYSYLRLGFPGGAIPNAVAYFDLVNGTVGTTLANTISTTIEDVGDGWYRCSQTAIATTTTTQGLSLIYVSQSDNQAAYIGSATSGIYIWGAQLEKGAAPTTYLPTTTVPVHDGSVIGQTEGTLYFEGSNQADSIADIMLSLNDASLNNRLQLFFSGANVIRFTVVSAGVTEADIQNVGFISGQVYKICAVYRNNYVALFVDGVKIGEDLTVNLPITYNISKDDGTGAFDFYGNENASLILNTALTDAEAIALTTP